MTTLQRLNPFVAMTCILALAVTLIAPSPASAKGPGRAQGSAQYGWDNVLNLKHGDAIIVSLFSKKAYLGKVESVEPESIAISLGKKKESMLISKEDVQSVALYEKFKATVAGGSIMAGGALLASMSQLVSSTKSATCLTGSSPSLSCGNGTNMPMIYAGLGVIAGGVAVMVLAGKPKYIYMTDQPAVAQGEVQAK